MKNSITELSQSNQLSRDNVIFNGMGFGSLVTFNNQSIIDMQINDDHFLTGGELIVKNGVCGDTVTMQVIDKDQVVKSLQIYGQPAGVTWGMVPSYPVMAQFYTNLQVIESSQRQTDFDLEYVAKIYAGTYLRLIYTSTGTVLAPWVGANFKLHKIRA